MNADMIDSEALAKALIKQAKNCNDIRKLYEIAEKLEAISRYCDASAFRFKAKSLSDKMVVSA